MASQPEARVVCLTCRNSVWALEGKPYKQVVRYFPSSISVRKRFRFRISFHEKGYLFTHARPLISPHLWRNRSIPTYPDRIDHHNGEVTFHSGVPHSLPLICQERLTGESAQFLLAL